MFTEQNTMYLKIKMSIDWNEFYKIILHVTIIKLSLVITPKLIDD